MPSVDSLSPSERARMDHDGNGVIDRRDRDRMLDELLSKTNLIENGRLNFGSAADSDPLGLANGHNVMIVDIANPSGVNGAPNSQTNGRDAALNPLTPWHDLFSLDETGNSLMYRLKPGDTVYVRGGTYELDKIVWIRTDGTQEFPITIRSYPGEQVTVRAGSYSTNWHLVSEGSFTRWEGIEFVGHREIYDAQGNYQGRLYAPNFMALRGEGSEIVDCIFRDNQGFPPDWVNQGLNPRLLDIGYGRRVNIDGSAQPIGQAGWGRLLDVGWSNGITVRDSVISPTSEELGVYPWQSGRVLVEGIVAESAHNLTIRGNTFRGGSGHQMLSIRIGCTGVLVENNDMANAMHTIMAFAGRGRTEPDGTVVRNVIRNNRFHDWNLYVNKMANALQMQGAADTDVYGNTFVNGGGQAYGIQLGSNPHDAGNARYNPPTENNRVFDNIFFNAGLTGIALVHLAGKPPEGLNIVNNNEVFQNIILTANLNPQERPRTDWSYRPITLNLDDAEGKNGHGNTVHDNIMYNLDGIDDIIVSSWYVGAAGTTRSYTAEQFAALGFGWNNLHRNVPFIDPVNGDFRLKPEAAGLDLPDWVLRLAHFAAAPAPSPVPEPVPAPAPAPEAEGFVAASPASPEVVVIPEPEPEPTPAAPPAPRSCGDRAGSRGSAAGPGHRQC